MMRDDAGAAGNFQLLTFNQVVVGSIPTGLTNQINSLEQKSVAAALEFRALLSTCCPRKTENAGSFGPRAREAVWQCLPLRWRKGRRQ